MNDNDILQRLRALSRYEHSDYSIGDEAADEIERLRAEVAASLERAARVISECDSYRARIKTSCRVNGQRVFDLLCIPIECDGDVAILRLEDGE